MQTILVTEILKDTAKRKPLAVSPEATILEVAKLLKQYDVGLLAVLDDSEVVGVVSERDIVGRAVLKNLSLETTVVSEIMTPDPSCVAPTDTLIECLERLNKFHCRHLPVVNQHGHLVGVLSEREIISVLVQYMNAENLKVFQEMLDLGDKAA